ncbi:MAG: septum formation initiator family protein [Proteobacteria bacterium]|nr:septum formation initiator family protein [Pseudomonadota bacterium]MBS0572463.1 septum formation initiator family protein [Pseudomonadota bacterium]
MRLSSLKPAVGAALTGAVLLGVGGYFTFAAVQGDFGVVKRAEITAEKQALTAERDRLKAEVARMQNLTRRLSDQFLDLDLLDERVRNVLGYVRADEIVVR